MAGQDWFEKDFYAALGVAKDADAATIKKAYRKLARTHHPDSNGGADARFKEIGEAYSVLSDPEQRKQYDAIRTMSGGGARFAPGASGGGAGAGGFEDVLGNLFGGAGASQRVRFPGGGRGSAGAGAQPDLEDLLSGMFGGTAGQTGYGPSAPRRTGEDIHATTTIGFREAVHGATVTLRKPDGTTITTRTPAGVRDGQRIRLRGKGMPGQMGPGDMIITVSVEAHPVFTRTGDDLAITLPVAFHEAALGAQVEVPTLDGSVQMKIPAGTPSGRVLRVKGRGITSGQTTGDLRVTIQVVVPQRLDDDARQAVEAYAAATGDADPRADLLARART